MFRNFCVMLYFIREIPNENKRPPVLIEAYMMV